MKPLLFIVLFISFTARSQIITTYVGTGVVGFSGNGGPATTANLNYPVGLCYDGHNNLLICQHDLIRKVNLTSNIISNIGGDTTAISIGDSGPVDSALVDLPYGICIDGYGNIYISDYWAIEVRKINITTGTIIDYAGVALHSGLSTDGGFADTSKLSSPNGVCIDTVRKVLYIADEFAYKIRKVDMVTGIMTTFAGTGVNGYSGDGGLANTAEFGRVLGLAIDAAGNVYIGDWDNERIRKIDVSTNIITTYAGNGSAGYGGDSGIATSAKINRPFGLCFDNCGNLVFADEFNNRIREVNTITGIITTIAGNGTAGFSGDSGLATAAELNGPIGVCFDDSNNLYISDYNNQRVRKVSYPNTAITLTSNIIVSTADTVCASMPVIFTAAATTSSGSISYQWYVDGSVVSTAGNTYTYTPANGDSIRCVVTAVNSCTSTMMSSNTINMVVNPLTVPTITVTAPASALAGSVVTVDATVAGAGSSYSINWYDNGELFNTTAVPVVTYVKGTGVDVITATVVPGSEGGCYDSTTSGAVSVAVSNAGIASPQPSPGERVTVYPNPVSDVVHVDLSPTLSKGEGGVTYRIMSMVGAELLKGDLKTGSNSIDVSGLGAGVYVLEVTGNGGGRIIDKIVKN